MADTVTTNYGFVKPEIGASEDDWGDKNNANWDDADATIKAVSDVANGALNKTAGGTVAGATNFTGGLQTGGEKVGYLGAPANTQDTNYTFVLTDAGKRVTHTSAAPHTYTIPPNSSAAFDPDDTIIPVLNKNGAGSLSIAPGSGVTLRRVGTTDVGTRTVAANGLVSLIKVGTDEWYITGAGLS